MPSIISILALAERGATVRSTSAISASTPPSPSLSARITNTTYLIETTMIMAQNSIEITPSTASVLKAMPCSLLKHSFRAYSGLVPMSPKTTPTARSTRARVLGLSTK
ncbi:hypothetical protein D3C81_968300 [compost metagenome]